MPQPTYQAHPDYISRTVAGTFMLIPVGEIAYDGASFMLGNETAAFLWEQLATPKTKQQLTEAALAAFEAPENLIAEQIEEFLQEQTANGLLLKGDNER